MLKVRPSPTRISRNYPDHLSGMPRSLPRRIEQVRLSITSLSVLPSPVNGRVGIHDFTFEACSSFTHVAACQIAGPPIADVCPEAPTRPVTRPSRSVATMLIDIYMDGFSLHWRSAPLRRTVNQKVESSRRKFVWLRRYGGVRAVSPERPDGGRWWQMAVPYARCTVPCCCYVACNHLVMTRLDTYDPCWRLHLLFTKILPDYPNLSERPDPSRIIFNDGVGQ